MITPASGWIASGSWAVLALLSSVEAADLSGRWDSGGKLKMGFQKTNVPAGQRPPGIFSCLECTEECTYFTPHFHTQIHTSLTPEFVVLNPYLP